MFPEHIDIQKLRKGEGISDNTVKLQSERKNHENVVSQGYVKKSFIEDGGVNHIKRC